VLVLTRHRGETIWIGDDVTISVEEIREGKVKLSIHAPKSVSVDRAEVREAKRAKEGGAA
jgi:carbon storage regulator